MPKAVTFLSKIRASIFCILPLFYWSHAESLSAFSRSGFLSLIRHGTLSLRILPGTQPAKASVDLPRVILPLRFLPKGGCWALKLIVSNDDQDTIYYGVLDTGSPFLTAPSSVVNVTVATKYPSTQEQYGDSAGEIVWRESPFLTLLGNATIIESKNFVLGVVDSPVLLQESGGIFVGMVALDDSRPTFLQQIGGGRYTTFVVLFARNSLELKCGSSIKKKDPEAFPLVDLQPYGSDLYHYAIDCSGFEIGWDDGDVEAVSASALCRPVYAVLDTGLTGCIFSDSLYSELQNGRGNDKSCPTGLKVCLTTQNERTLEVQSSDNCWIFSSFQLPWFTDEDRHPHIIAMGCTFWANCESLTIDTLSSRAKIILRKQQ